MQKENNSILNNVVDEILLNELQNVQAMREETKLLYSDYNEKNLNQV